MNAQKGLLDVDFAPLEQRVMALAEGYGAGDIAIGRITGRYPNPSALTGRYPRDPRIQTLPLIRK